MINLLPPQEKAILKKEEKYRLILILGILTMLFGAIFSLILFSIKIYISGKVEAQKILFALEEENFRTSEIQKIEAQINSINQNLAKLDSFYGSQTDLSGLAEKVAEILPEGAYLNSFSLKYLSKKENKLQIFLRGFCPTREALFGFKQKLEAEPDFQAIYFPPENWVKSKEIDFSVNFEINL